MSNSDDLWKANAIGHAVFPHAGITHNIMVGTNILANLEKQGWELMPNER